MQYDFCALNKNKTDAMLYVEPVDISMSKASG